MSGRGSYLALALLCVLAIAPSPAAADDGNSLPPSLELRASGTEESPVGLNGGSLASYSTAEPDSSWGYPDGSPVSFTCLLDGQPTPCSPSYYRPCCPVAIPRARIACPRRQATGNRHFRRRHCPIRPTPQPVIPPGKVLGYGPVTGWVPIPQGLADGPHTVTVIAADEDGADPNPPSVTAVFDTTPPAPPEFLSVPRRISRDQTPRFRFSATDSRKLHLYNDPFSASLRRVQPPGPRIFTGDPFGSYLEWRGPFCPTIFRCTEVAWPVYSGNGEGGTTFGIREHLRPGLYEFSAKVSDSVGNESATTSYRFRVLGAKHR